MRIESRIDGFSLLQATNQATHSINKLLPIQTVSGRYGK